MADREVSTDREIETGHRPSTRIQDDMRVTSLSPRNTEEAMEWFRRACNGPDIWDHICLVLQRTARGIPAVNPSANAAANATPLSDRIHKLSHVRRGMVAYFDDPTDSNPFGHIAGVSTEPGSKDGWTVFSNDVFRAGQCDRVRASFFPDHWGDHFKFAAISLNGWDLDGPWNQLKKPRPKAGRENIVANLKATLDALESEPAISERHQHPHRAQTITDDIQFLHDRLDHLTSKGTF